ELSNHFDDHLLLIEKYNPEKVFTIVYLEGRSGSHYLKRFVFDNLSIGKKTSVISEDNGSKLVLLTGIQKPRVSLQILKGKTKLTESVEMDLAETIEVKGMKALGNRISPHEVKSIELLASEMEYEQELMADEILNDTSEDSSELPGIHTATPVSSLAINLEEAEEKTILKDDLTAEKPPASEVEIEPQGTEENKLEELNKTDEQAQSKEEAKPDKKIDFEITNPDDLDIDDKGQFGLF
ncbi:MAG: DNA gyrase/topoisomerase IV subunit A, partial [Phormidesmis sp. FL-bin-119]|nr:DNA gyrase/topoisomerase IV subunit A [Pedobacter sp.]